MASFTTETMSVRTLRSSIFPTDAAHFERSSTCRTMCPTCRSRISDCRMDCSRVAAASQEDLDGVVNRGQRVAEFVGQHR